VASEADRADAPLDDPDNGAQHRGLAGAIALAEGDQLACANLERHPVQHVRLAVPGAQSLDLEKIRHGGLPRRLGVIAGTEIARDHRGIL